MANGLLVRVHRVALLALLLAPASSIALYGFEPDLGPKTYVSPSGETTLLVDPSDRSGAGEARYELRRNGAVVWSGARPFTLWDASVADDGTVGGYGYSLGYNRPVDPAGDFLVVILDPSGGSRLVEKTPRKSSLVIHSMADPHANGQFLDPANDRFVVRVWDRDAEAGRESWWTYRLATGEPVGRAAPAKLTSEERLALRVVGARPVPETPLTLVHFWLQDFGSETPDAPGARFTLVDPDYLPVWTLDLPGDYRVRGDAAGEGRLALAIFEHGGILDTRPPRRFEIRHAADGMRVSYTVDRDPQVPAGWTVREAGRSPYVEPPPAHAASALVFPEVALRKLGSISLASRSAHPEDSPIRGISDFASDDRGRFGFLPCEGCGSAAPAALVVVDAEGALVQRIALPELPPRGDSWFTRRLAWIEGDRWLVATSEHGTAPKTSAVWIDLRTGAATPVEGFACPPIEALAPMRDGGFVALTRSHARYTVVDALYAFDAQGRQRWRVGASFEDEALLFDPADVTVTTAGEVVVLEGVANQLKVYGPDGVHQRSVDLEEAWGRPPNYLSGIAADAEGGVVVFDFNGEPPVVRMKRDGTVLAALTPTFPGKRAFGVRGRVQTGPDGRLWASDGHAILRLDDHGVVDRVLGEKRNAESLGRVAAMRVDGKGWIYAADGRTAAVHVFDPEGQRVRVYRPDAGDYDDELVLPSLTVSDAGDVFVARRGLPSGGAPDFLHYSPSRGRVGVESLPLDDIKQDWHWQPTTGSRWVLGYQNLYLVSADGSALRAIERTAQDRWLERPGPAGIAPDGRIAVVSEALPRTVETSDGPRVVTIYSREGDALVTWPAPDGLLTWAGAAFDGSRFVALVRTPSGNDDGEGAVAVAALDASGTPLFRFAPPAAGEEMRPFLVPRGTGSELWLFDGRASIDRYALP